jgi:acyl carrier protein
METKVRQVMALVLDVPEAEIGEGFSSSTIGTWDSIRHLNLIMAIEDAFHVSFSSEEIGTLDSYDAIVHALRRLDAA